MKRTQCGKLLVAAVAAMGVAGCGATDVVYRSPAPDAGFYQSPYDGSAYAPADYVQQALYSAAPSGTLLDAYQMDQLTGPVALYPDPLLAALLPACTYPDEIAAAASWLCAYPNPTQAAIDAQPWDPSVKALIQYPAVLQQLAGNLEWTRALGAAFVNQQQEVMDSIQRLRAQARAAGNLNSNAYQDVGVDEGCLEILPVNPDYVYVPVYNPVLAYAEPCEFGFDFFPLGGYSTFCFDWHDHRIGCGFDWRHFDERGREHRGFHEWTGGASVDSRRAAAGSRDAATLYPPRESDGSVPGQRSASFFEHGTAPDYSRIPTYQPQIHRPAIGVQPRAGYEFQPRVQPQRAYTPRPAAPQSTMPRFQSPAPHFAAPRSESHAPHYQAPAGHSSWQGGSHASGGGGHQR